MDGKIIGFGKVSFRNKPIRQVGIDTNLILAWIENEKHQGKYRPSFCKSKTDKLFINYKVFGELMGLLNREDNNPSSTKDAIFNFLRRNNISLLKKSLMDHQKFKEAFEKLQQSFSKKSKKSDLEIIAVFYTFGIDCIFSSDEKHFENPCNFLGINYEKHFEIEIGSEQDVRRMLKRLRPRGYKKKR